MQGMALPHDVVRAGWTPTEMARLHPPAAAHFAPALAVLRRVTGIAVFTQRPGDCGPAPFLLAERLPLRG